MHHGQRVSYEFRENVIRVYRDSGSSVAHVAKDFGISPPCPKRWLAVDDRNSSPFSLHSGRRGRTLHHGLGGPSSVLHAGDVGSEEVDAVAVEVAAGPVVVLGGSWVGVPSEDLRVA